MTKKIFRLILLLLFFCCGLLPRVSLGSNDNDTFVKAMAQHLSCYPLELIGFKKQKPIIDERDVCLATIYHETGASALWVSSEGPRENAAILRDHFRFAYKEGINPEDYEISSIDKLWHSDRAEDLARLDTLLTYNLVKYIHDMSFGQIRYQKLDPDLFAEAGNKDFDPVVAIRTALSAPDLAAYLDALTPQHTYYKGLRTALAFYQGISQNHDWTDIPSGPLIRPGQQDERLEAIQRRLSITGEAPARVMLVEVYDDELVSAVKTFQSLHGLNPDGIIGPKTRAWLSKSPQDLANIIRVNMARWRWQSHELGKSRTYIIVNIAGFSLTAVQEGTPVLEMPVIVGKLQHRTPVFSDTIQYLDFNPFWNIPPQIARDEELPALRKNPRHLADRHVRVFSSWQSDAVELDSLAIDWKTIGRSRMSAFKLRQDPGPWNALGRVKFVFPNNHSVYLHDTPTQDLFEQTVRTFSHGCIRVSNPLKLASFCLNQQPGSWSESEISRIMADRDRMVINLKNALPIHITYQTSWLDKNGTIHFSSDIYGRDKRLQDALKNR